MALDTLVSIIIKMFYFIISEGIKIVLTLGEFLIEFFIVFFQTVKGIGLQGILLMFAIFFPFLYLVGKVFFDSIKKVILFGSILLILLLLGIFLI